MKLTGFVFGHYDSRGGTAFVVDDSQDGAKKKYWESIWQGCGEYSEDNNADEDLLGAATLEIEGDINLKEDLEDQGLVLMRSQEGETRFFLNKELQHELRFVRIDAVPRLCEEDHPDEVIEMMRKDDSMGFWHPSWYDDAYGFIVIQ